MAEAQQTVGLLLKVHREQVGLSIQALARKVGRDGSGLLRYEQGRRKPGRADLLALAQALRLPPWATEQLLMAGGFASNDPLVQALVTALADEDLTEDRRQEARGMLAGLVRLLDQGGQDGAVGADAYPRRT